MGSITDKTSHFPERLPSSSSFSISYDRSFSHPGLWARAKFGKAELDSIEGAIELKAAGRYRANDSCILVIDKHLTEENWTDFEKSSRDLPPVSQYTPCSGKNLPIPKFWRKGWSETSSTLTNLKSGYNLCVLDSKRGSFLEPEKLPNGKFTPEGWIHGYSRGVAINKKESTAIFWYDVW